MFHVHVDALSIPSELERFCVGPLGMARTDFSGHPEGYTHFEPSRHLTAKVREGSVFRRMWADLVREAVGGGFVGYLEGEFIAMDDGLPWQEYRPTDVPFRLHRRRLRGGDQETFRETELHLSLDAERSDPRLVSSLLRAGLYGAFIPKEDHCCLVLTAQGWGNEILPLVECLKSFISRVGGARTCTLKEERVVNYELFGVSPQDLPEVVDRVEWIESHRGQAEFETDVDEGDLPQLDFV